MLPVAAVLLATLGLLTFLLVRGLRQSLEERAAFEAHAAHLAYHDALTGLPNRALLRARMEERLAQPKTGSPPAMLLIDLDRFKEVNDTLGHLAGDQLIQGFAAKLRALVGPEDTVARLGGDEFAVLPSRSWSRAAVENLCRQITELFTTPFEVLETQVFGGASIGAAFAEDGLCDCTELMRRADVALYRAKEDGGVAPASMTNS